MIPDRLVVIGLSTQPCGLQVERLCLFASQIAEGMKFLSNENYIHRDLSTRNVLVQNQYKVRISDLGLSRVGVGSNLCILYTVYCIVNVYLKQEEKMN